MKDYHEAIRVLISVLQYLGGIKRDTIAFYTGTTGFLMVMTSIIFGLEIAASIASIFKDRLWWGFSLLAGLIFMALIMCFDRVIVLEAGTGRSMRMTMGWRLAITLLMHILTITFAMLFVFENDINNAMEEERKNLRMEISKSDSPLSRNLQETEEIVKKYKQYENTIADNKNIIAQAEMVVKIEAEGATYKSETARDTFQPGRTALRGCGPICKGAKISIETAENSIKTAKDELQKLEQAHPNSDDALKNANAAIDEEVHRQTGVGAQLRALWKLLGSSIALAMFFLFLALLFFELVLFTVVLTNNAASADLRRKYDMEVQKQELEHAIRIVELRDQYAANMPKLVVRLNHPPKVVIGTATNDDQEACHEQNR